ncbi:RdgB/HAM1 family non-canonical purine NTP pyrophosphatase [Peptoniphilus sp. HCN-40583]|uniref:RdgB/HAM1 family non-canonical purine NTP pyrophosphatase n=1 Tax=Peptoniphilus sp. HCN-40583 TaxID=3134662 RepID=UPI0030C291A7
MNIILSTDNAHKLKEIRELVDGKFRVLTKTEAGYGDIHPVEDGDTLQANAMKKIESLEGEIVIGDDTGLFVSALQGRPGVYSARYAGEEGNDEKNREKLLREMEGKIDRSAYFKTVIAVKRGDEIYTVEGICPGHITESPRGEGGFGYDPLFIPEGYDKTFAEMADAEKNAVSHRGRALRAFVETLKS